MAYTPATAAILRQLLREQGRRLYEQGRHLNAVPPVREPELPAMLRGIAPRVGDVWEWEPLKGYARQTVRVTAVTWDGYDCKVESELIGGGTRCWNDLTRWVEATVLVSPA